MVTPRIPANKIWIADEAIYYLLARPALTRSFDHIWLAQYGPRPDPQRGPYIFYLNHSAWWDGYMMMLIHRAIMRRAFDSYLMMEERQLRAYRFFTWCGAFSIERCDPAESQRAQIYAANLLRERRDRALYIFPQGRIEANDYRPLTIYPGIARIAALAGDVTLCPIALRYEFLGQQWPHAFVQIGPPHLPASRTDIEAIRADVAARLTAAVDTLRADVIEQRLGRFQPLLSGRWGIDRTWDAVRGWFQRRDADGGPAAAAANRLRARA
ncbi:lysophospholipid acyltransferase family protein [Chloroflexus sp.]|uniref:lysophospholipid acyltransferase family protein n=1 Tax=Chloroflexus sp. TaxID=1904827 RepID=UPI002ACE5B08|nr:lysophospholipid acyltransferase family protein [Chloroflexus sp.]